MNRTLKDATIRSFHYATLDELSAHLRDYLWAYKSARPLRALKGKTPIGFILDRWQDAPKRFHEDPVHYFPGPYSHSELEFGGAVPVRSMFRTAVSGR